MTLEKILRETPIGTYFSIAIKGQPKPVPKPLYLSDYRVDLGGIYKLEKAIRSHLLGLIDQCLTDNDSETHIIADDLRGYLK